MRRDVGVNQVLKVLTETQILPPDLRKQTKFVRTIYVFGSKTGQDIDLLVVTNNCLSYEEIRFRRFDMTLVSRDTLTNMTNNLNPVATEPILTGRPIYGPEEFNLQRNIPTAKKDQICEQLLEASRFFYQRTNYLYTSNKFAQALKSLSFAVSCIVFASYYRKNNRVITFSELLKTHPNNLLIEITKTLKGKKNIGINDVGRFLGKSKFLISSSSTR